MNNLYQCIETGYLVWWFVGWSKATYPAGFTADLEIYTTTGSGELRIDTAFSLPSIDDTFVLHSIYDLKMYYL